VPGGLRRLCLFALSAENSATSIISYVDLRWFTGESFLKSGFLLESVSPPNYFYVRGQKRLSRFSFAKHTLKDKLPVFDPALSEKENMKNNGYFIIHDCGSLKFRLWK